MNSFRPDRDLRSWLKTLDNENELARITVPVGLEGEVAAIARRCLSEDGPALLFENIVGHENSWCNRLFTNGLGSSRRLALMFGQPKNTKRRVLSEIYHNALHNPITPIEVSNGPVKENIITGDNIDLNSIPVPLWHELDGGRYINTWCGVVTRDPDTGKHNVGTYRGMTASKNQIGVLLLTSQHWGHHFVKYAQRHQKMPVAIVYGWNPSLFFCAGSQVPTDLCEYDVTGAIMGEPVQLVKCETSDILVPASAEIVVEGFLDCTKLVEEGPFGEYTGYYTNAKPRYVVQVTTITHRNNPVYRGSLEGSGPGAPNEDSMIYSVSTKPIMLEVLERAGIPGIIDVRPGVVSIIKIKQMYRGHAKQIANALWGSWASEWMWKVLMVVDDDVNIYSEQALQAAAVYRVDPLKNDIVIMPGTRGGSLDPSNTDDEQDDIIFGTGQWNRILIDATRQLNRARRNEYGLPEWEPSAAEVPEEWARVVNNKWSQYNIPKFSR